MDARQRDAILAQWLLSHARVSQEQLSVFARQCAAGADFPTLLVTTGVIDQASLQQFLFQLDSAIRANPPSSHGPIANPPSSHPSSSHPPSSQRSNSRSSQGSRALVEGQLPQVGQVLAEYEIISELGRGGMGAVYKVRRPGGDVRALKVLLAAEGASEEARERFKREFQALERISHPSLIRVYEAGFEAGLDYYVMDCLPDAKSLTQFVSDNELSIWQAVKLLQEQALALDVAHRAGLIHRDVKPGNLLVDETGRPWVVDFGLARDVDRQTRLTQSGAYLGTPAYMAPEQCADSAEVDARADVYALGAVLYELLTNRKPFESDSLTALLAEIFNRSPDRPSSIVEFVDPRLEAICLKALAKKPEDRYPSAAAFAEDLRRAQNNESVSALAGARRRATLRILVFAALLIASSFGAYKLWGGAAERRAQARLLGFVQRLRPILQATEERLSVPGELSLQRLEEAMDLVQKESQGLVAPSELRELQLRADVLRAEEAFRRQDFDSAASFVSAAELEFADLEAADPKNFEHFAPIKALLAARDPGTPLAERQRRFERSLSRLQKRGDLNLLKARLALEAGDSRGAELALAEASASGFNDERLRFDILLANGSYAELVAGLAAPGAPAAQARDAKAFEALVMIELKHWRVGEAAKHLQKTLELLQGETVAIERVVKNLWTWAEQNVNKRESRELHIPGRAGELNSLFDSIYKALPSAAPASLGPPFYELGLFLRERKSLTQETAMIALAEWGCRLAPQVGRHWDFWFSNDILDNDAPPKFLERAVALAPLGLQHIQSPSSRFNLIANAARLYRYLGRSAEALKALPDISDADLRVDGVAASKAIVQRCHCLIQCEADAALVLRELQRAKAELLSADMRDVNLSEALMFRKLQRFDDAARAYLASSEHLQPNAGAGKWAQVVRGVLSCSESNPALIAELRATLERRKVRSEFQVAIDLFEALTQHDQARLDAVLARAKTGEFPDAFSQPIKNIQLPKGPVQIAAALAFLDNLLAPLP